MGTPEFAVPSLEILVEHEYPIVAVVTAPDKPRGRGQKLAPSPVKTIALRSHLPVLQPESMKDPAFADRVRSLQPDLIVVTAFRILPKEVFTIPTLGSFNLHASLLPKYRGAAPIHWAIMNGEHETGVTTFLLQEKVDTGNMILQQNIPIQNDDDAGSLHDKLSTLGAQLVLETARLLEQGKAVPKVQDDSLATPAPKIFKEDCLIRWDQPVSAIHNRIRGLSPFPAAFTLHAGKILKLYKSRVLDRSPKGSPGTVRVTPDSLHVATSDGMIAILELQQEGRRRMHVEEFLRGYRISSGEQFT